MSNTRKHDTFNETVIRFVGKHILQRRNELGLSVDYMAFMMGMSIEEYEKIENEVKNLETDELWHICLLLNTNVASLFPNLGFD